MLDRSVSVVIPFFRRQDTFPATLHSVLQQTLKPLEIIVVDDASGGDAIEFLEQYTGTITLIRLPHNVGVSEARNIGVEAASGNYIAFLDSDDRWEPDKLRRQLDYLQCHPQCDAVHTGVRTLSTDGRMQCFLDKPARLTKADLVNSSHLICQSLLMKKSDFLRLGGFDRSFRQTEDYEFSLRMVVNGMHIDFIPEVLVTLQRGRSDHLSGNWRGYISGHLRVVWRYARVFREAENNFSPCRHTGRYLVRGGIKCGGLRGRLISLLGHCIRGAFKITSSERFLPGRSSPPRASVQKDRQP